VSKPRDTWACRERHWRPSAVLSKRIPAPGGLPRADETGGLPSDHHQRLYGNDHAPGETSACLTLSFLTMTVISLSGESDFVVIPSGILLANISGRPVFLNDPTYPHDGIITLRSLHRPPEDGWPEARAGQDPDPFRIRLRGGPKVEMGRGQVLSNIIPDFASGAGPGSRRDRRAPVPSHLPLPDRYPVRLRQPVPGSADARLSLDDRVWRLSPGDGICPPAREYRLGRPLVSRLVNSLHKSSA